jgi:hypothetical protein
MQTITTIGLDIAKSVFQVHGVDAQGKVIVRRQLKRRYVLAFFQKLPPCLIGIEACASSHYWSRELQALGHTMRLMPPAYVKPYVKRQKNDSADAEAICEAVTRANMRHMRRWVRLCIAKDYFVEWNGKPVQSIKVGYKRSVALAGLIGKITPHTLRHTAATWLMQAGVPIWEAAGFLGMSPAMVEQIYGHHHPAHMRGAAKAIAGNKNTSQSLAISLAGAFDVKEKAQ